MRPVERATVMCGHCGLEFKTLPSRFRQGNRGRFCSIPCRADWMKTSALVPLSERFWRHVEKTASCWLWTGFKNKYGYGIVRGENGREKIMAHRASWALAGKSVPADLCLDHLCRVRHCVNPEHLEVVTIKENNRRGLGVAGLNARKTHCKRGHLLAGENIYLRATGARICKQCVDIRARAA